VIQDLLDHLVMTVELEELVLLDLLVHLEQWLKEKRFQDPLVLLVLMEPQECLEIPELKVKWEQEETWDPGGLRVKMVYRDHPVCKESRADLEMLGSQVCKVRRETQDLVEKWDLLGFKEHLDCLDNQGSREYLACQETREPPAEKEILVLLVLMAKMVLMVKMDHLGHQETEESQEKMEAQVSRV